MIRSSCSKIFLNSLKKILQKQCFRNTSANAVPILTPCPSYVEFKNEWPLHEKESFLKDMIVIEDFLSEDEETKLFEEVEPYMKRLRYEFDHWDDAIHGYRETERQHWYPHNKLVINRVNKTAFKEEIMSYMHVLDLAAEGVIKPHVDSSRYCGSTIAGLSLLSDCVMRLVRTDETKYQQVKENKDEYRSISKTNSSESNFNGFFANVFLKQRSLYIMRDTARYNFTHEILGNDVAEYKGKKTLKNRRISVICRNKP